MTADIIELFPKAHARGEPASQIETSHSDLEIHLLAQLKKAYDTQSGLDEAFIKYLLYRRLRNSTSPTEGETVLAQKLLDRDNSPETLAFLYKLFSGDDPRSAGITNKHRHHSCLEVIRTFIAAGPALHPLLFPIYSTNL